jgi:hypothetical protein
MQNISYIVHAYIITRLANWNPQNMINPNLIAQNPPYKT